MPHHPQIKECEFCPTDLAGSKCHVCEGGGYYVEFALIPTKFCNAKSPYDLEVLNTVEHATQKAGGASGGIKWGTHVLTVRVPLQYFPPDITVEIHEQKVELAEAGK